MGCLSRVGCLVVLAATGAGAYWFYGDRLPSEVLQASKRASQGVATRVRSADSARRAGNDSVERSIGWVRLDDQLSDDPRAVAATDRLRGLARRTGPAFATFDANDIASVLAPALVRLLPRTASETSVALTGDEIMLRSVVELRDFAGTSAVGALLGGALGGRDTIRVSGTLDSRSAGVAQLRVRELRLKGISIPAPLIPTVVRLLRDRGAAPNSQTVFVDSLPANALLLKLPASVADIRVHDGRITLYRATP